MRQARILQTFYSSFRLQPKPMLLLGIVFVLHALLGAAVGLSVDEAHYLLYAQHLAWSYFDHPPLVGWLQWPMVALDAPVGVIRLIPGVLWISTVWFMYRFTQSIQKPDDVTATHAGFWTVVVLTLAPLLHLLGLGLLPDTLLAFFTAAVMWQTLQLMQQAVFHKPLPWLILGLLLGLAGLSKYTAIFLAAAVGISLTAVHGWRLFRNPWSWVAGLLAVVMVTPVIVWNAQNGWLSFHYQANHASGDSWQVAHVVRFLLLQVLVYGPLLLWGGPGWWRARASNTRVFSVFFLIPFGVLAVLSGGASGLPHWSAPAWIALAPFAGLGLAYAVHYGQQLLIRSLVCLQVVCCIGLLGLMFTAGLPFFSVDARAVADTPNPFADLHGWQEAGARARALAQRQQLDSVAVQNWTLASRLGWYARPLPVHVLQDRFDQFDVWAGDLPVGKGTLLVDWSQMSYETPLGAHGFDTCTLLDTMQTFRWGVPVSTFRFFACHNWSGNPRPVLLIRPLS